MTDLLPFATERRNLSAAAVHRFPPRVAAIIQSWADRANEERYREGYWPVSVATFLSSERAQELRPWRAACWKELRELRMANGRPPSFPQIGRWFGRDHTAIVSQVNEGRRERRRERDLARKLAA